MNETVVADPAVDVNIWIPVLLLAFALLLVNGAVFVILASSGLLISRQNAFVVNVLLFDTLRGFIAIIEIITLLALPEWDSFAVFCHVMGFMKTFSAVGACLALPILLYDRLMFVSSPINYFHRMTRRLAAVVFTYAVFHSLLVSSMPLLGWGRYVYDRRFHTCDVSWSTPRDVFAPFAVTWGWMLPLVASVVCFWRIWQIVRLRITQIRVYSKAQARLEPMGLQHCISVGSITEADMAFVKTARLLGVIALCYSTSHVFQMGLYIRLMIPVGLDGMAPAAYIIATVISFLSGLVNPLMYGVYNRKFKQTLIRFLTCGRKSESEVSNIAEYPQRTSSMRALAECPRRRASSPSLEADTSGIGIIVKRVWTEDIDV